MVARKYRMAVRHMGSHAKPETYKPKSFKEAWLSDPGVSDTDILSFVHTAVVNGQPFV